jgi:hypothetical protein
VPDGWRTARRQDEGVKGCTAVHRLSRRRISSCWRSPSGETMLVGESDARRAAPWGRRDSETHDLAGQVPIGTVIRDVAVHAMHMHLDRLPRTYEVGSRDFDIGGHSAVAGPPLAGDRHIDDGQVCSWREASLGCYRYRDGTTVNRAALKRTRPARRLVRLRPRRRARGEAHDGRQRDKEAAGVMHVKSRVERAIRRDQATGLSHRKCDNPVSKKDSDIPNNRFISDAVSPDETALSVRCRTMPRIEPVSYGSHAFGHARVAP